MTAEVFQAALHPSLGRSAAVPTLTNAASFDTTALARGSIVAAFGAELASAQAASKEAKILSRIPARINRDQGGLF